MRLAEPAPRQYPYRLFPDILDTHRVKLIGEYLAGALDFLSACRPAERQPLHHRPAAVLDLRNASSSKSYALVTHTLPPDVPALDVIFFLRWVGSCIQIVYISICSV